MNFPAGITELERALMVAAYVVMRHGEAYLPLLNRLESEVERERSAENYRDRASGILKRFTREVTHAVR